MSTLHWASLLLLAAFAGAVVPFQSAINVNLGRGLGHPLWATLASLVVSILVLLPIMLAMRLPLPSMAFIGKAPLWMWAGGAFGVFYFTGAGIAAQAWRFGIYGVGVGGASGGLAGAGPLWVVWVGGAANHLAAIGWGNVVDRRCGVD